MVLSKRFTSIFMLILAFSLAMPLEAMTAQPDHIQIEKSQKKSIKSKKSLFEQVQQFIHKHQMMLTTIGALGAFLFVAYIIPKAPDKVVRPKQQENPHQQPIRLQVFPPIDQLNLQPVDNGYYFHVGESQCPGIGVVVLQPGVHQGNWNPHLVDGNNGHYALRNSRNQRVFVPRLPNRNAGERNPIAIRFQLNQPIHVCQLRVVRQLGDTCAYHALKNCQLILNELENPQGNLDARLNDPVFAREQIGRWREHIVARHPQLCSDRDGQWLHPAGLHELVRREGENNRITVVDAGRFQEHLAQNPFALPQLYNINARHEGHDFVHGFVVQDRAHWLTAVVRRVHGQIEWLIVDSNNLPAFNRAGLMHLLARLHGRVA